MRGSQFFSNPVNLQYVNIICTYIHAYLNMYYYVNMYICKCCTNHKPINVIHRLCTYTYLHYAYLCIYIQYYMQPAINTMHIILYILLCMCIYVRIYRIVCIYMYIAKYIEIRINTLFSVVKNYSLQAILALSGRTSALLQ